MNPNAITIGLSPNVEPDDVWRAIGMFCSPWRWRDGDSVSGVEQWFQQRFAVRDAVSFNSGRSAMLALLQAFGIGSGDEVIVQAFTCVAVADPILWAGATPRYADIDVTYTMDPSSLQKCISKKTKAIVVQHTFGYPAQMYTIKKIAQKHCLILIEDCCHSLGATNDGKPVGSVGDAAFFSFGRDKVISSVFGGMAIISNEHHHQQQKLRSYQRQLRLPKNFWIFQQLLHPLISDLVLPIYASGIGKMILFLCQKLHLLSFPVYPEEKKGGQPDVFPTRYPNALAYLAWGQLQKLERYNAHRQQIAAYYEKKLASCPAVSLIPWSAESIYLRFTVRSSQRNALMAAAKKKSMILGNWYANVIDPPGVDYGKIGYVRGSCPQAENMAADCLNLPTYPRMNFADAKRVVSLLTAV